MNMIGWSRKLLCLTKQPGEAASLLTGVLGMSSQYEYWNPELDIRRDILRLAFWIVTIGITTVVVQNGILWVRPTVFSVCFII